jgi:GDP-L-fucose synthase
MNIFKNKKIYIAGHNGMVGSSVLRKLKDLKVKKIIYRNRKQLDLCDFNKTEKFIKINKPDIIINCAGKVGGIMFNVDNPVDILEVNALIQVNLIKAAYNNKVPYFIYLGSSCIYPKNSKQPIKEDYLLSDKPEPTNEGYALSKIVGLKSCEYYNKQYGKNYVTLMPCNLYGPNDNFDLRNSHFIPAFVNKYVEAFEKKIPFIEVWGSGNAKREIMHVDDLSSAILFILEKIINKNRIILKIIKEKSFLNVGSGKDYTIKQYAKLMGKHFDKKIKIKFNKKYPEGMKRKLLDISLIKKLGWKPKISINKGFKDTISWYIKNKDL